MTLHGTQAASTATRRDLLAYLGGAGLWLAGANLQQFLVTWLLVGMLAEPGARVGAAQLAIAAPGFLLMLLGGGAGDRTDARTLLLRVHALAVLPPLTLAFALQGMALSYGLVIAFGVAVSALAGFSEPGRAALLSRVATGDIQRAVVLSTVVSALCGLAGTWLGGRIDALGLAVVLVLQAALFGAGGVVLVGMLALQPPTWLLVVATLGWGMNMGVTNTMARALVQANAPEAHRARVLSVFILGTMAAAPLGAVLLGTLVDLAGVRAGFVPALVASGVILGLGVTVTPIWHHRDPSAQRSPST